MRNCCCSAPRAAVDEGWGQRRCACASCVCVLFSNEYVSMCIAPAAPAPAPAFSSCFSFLSFSAVQRVKLELQLEVAHSTLNSVLHACLARGGRPSPGTFTGTVRCVVYTIMMYVCTTSTPSTWYTYYASSTADTTSIVVLLVVLGPEQHTELLVPQPQCHTVRILNEEKPLLEVEPRPGRYAAPTDVLVVHTVVVVQV